MGYIRGSGPFGGMIDKFMNGKSQKIRVLKRINISQGKELFNDNNSDFGRQIQGLINKTHDEVSRQISELVGTLEEWQGSELSDNVRVSKKPVKITIRTGKYDDLICTVVIEAKVQYFTNIKE